MFYPEEKMIVLIDGAYTHSTARALDFDIDYNALHKKFSTSGNLLRINYYTVVVEKIKEDDSENNSGNMQFSPVKPLIDFLSYNGFNIVTKNTREYMDGDRIRKTRGSIDIDLAVDAMCASDYVDHIVLCTGNREFQPLIAALQKRGVRVTVMSSIETKPVMCADDLRRQADHFIDLADWESDITRNWEKTDS